MKSIDGTPRPGSGVSPSVGLCLPERKVTSIGLVFDTMREVRSIGGTPRPGSGGINSAYELYAGWHRALYCLMRRAFGYIANSAMHYFDNSYLQILMLTTCL